MKKIALLTSMEERCGVASYSRDFMVELCKLTAVEMMSFPAQTDEGWERLAAEINQSYRLLHIQYHPNFCGYWRNPRQILRFYDFLKSFSIPVVVTIHDLLDDRMLQSPEMSIRRRAFYALLKPFLRKTFVGDFLCGGFLRPADHFIIHWTHPIPRLLELKIAENQVSVLYPGIPEFPDTGTSELQIQLGDRLALGIFGFIRGHKGIETTLKALLLLPEKVVLLLAGGTEIGNDSYLEFIKSEIEKMGLEKRVLFLGALQDSAAISVLRQCRIILLPYEPPVPTASYAISYACAARRLILGSDMPYLKEISDRFGAVRTFKKGDPEDLAGKVLKLLEGDSELERKIEIFSRDWSWAQVAARTKVLYDSLLTPDFRRHAQS